MRILVVAGPSGGHIFPALGLLDALKDEYADISTLLILPGVCMQGQRLSEGGIINQGDNANYNIKYVSASSIKLGIDYNAASAILRFSKGFLECIFILLRFRPRVVVGFGSLVCVLLIISAKAFCMKTIIHEQNVIAGRANRFLSGFADKIAVSFVETKECFRGYRRKVLLTGNPLRKELCRIDKNKALDFFGFNKDKLTILVMGGSQGSHRINAGFLKVITTMANRSRIQVIHLTGFKDYALLSEDYKGIDINIRLFNFLRPMHYAYSASDLIVSRAGATAIAEIAYFKTPAIFIPYPYAYQHQLSNAKVLREQGTAIIVDDDALDTDILRQVIDDFVNNPYKIEEMRSRYADFPQPDAGKRLAHEVLALCQH